MTRFFASSKGCCFADQPPRRASTNEGGKSHNNGSTQSRWGRRPRLRRQCAHEFDNTPSTKPEVREQVARESGSGYTEAPSSRGASDTLSAPSPTVAGIDDDILADVSEDDLSWLEAELPSTVPTEEDLVETPEEEASRTEAIAAERRRRAELAPPLVLRVEDFECGECVGKGSYSRVFLGTHVPTGTEWALKVVSKRRTFETRENLTHLREEKNIAEKAQGSDFLVRTAGTFQNPKSVVFAMEYLPGGDLYQRLADKGTLPLGEAVAWVAQAVLAIEDLHSLNIVHRDVKPENFLMGKSGTLKLSDFGFARELAPNERLFSQFGTPEYVAPEVLNGCGHGKPVDLWALGVLVYELLVGRTPFKASSVDDMYERIAAGDYAFPLPPARRSSSARRSTSGRYSATHNGGNRGDDARSQSHRHRKVPYSSSKRQVQQQQQQQKQRGQYQGYGYSCSYDGRGVAGVYNSSMSRFDSTSSATSSTSSYYLPTPSGRHAAQSSARPSPYTTVTSPRRRHEESLWRAELLREAELERRERDMLDAGSVLGCVEFNEHTDLDFHAENVKTMIEEEEQLDGAQDPAAQSLVKNLLQLNPARRPSIPDIKSHPFFDGVNFDALRAAVRAQADAEEEEAIVAAAIDGGDVWLRNQRVSCISEDVDDSYGGVFVGF